MRQIICDKCKKKCQSKPAVEIDLNVQIVGIPDKIDFCLNCWREVLTFAGILKASEESESSEDCGGCEEFE